MNRPLRLESEFFADNCASAFEQAGFADFWNLESELVDEPNAGRGGESTISRAVVGCPDGKRLTVYIKRQRNYRTRTLRHPFRGIPTAQREFQVLQTLRRSGVSVPEPLYFGVASSGSDFRAILVTLALEAYMSWQQLQDERRAGMLQAPSSRWACLRKIGTMLGTIHRAGLRHTCFYPKHVLIRDAQTEDPQVSVLDVENAKWNVFGLIGTWKDVEAIVGRRGTWSSTDTLRFLDAYCTAAGRSRVVQRWLYHRLRWVQRARQAQSGKPLPRFATARSALFAGWRLLS